MLITFCCLLLFCVLLLQTIVVSTRICIRFGVFREYMPFSITTPFNTKSYKSAYIYYYQIIVAVVVLLFGCGVIQSESIVIYVNKAPPSSSVKYNPPECLCLQV